MYVQGMMPLMIEILTILYGNRLGGSRKVFFNCNYTTRLNTQYFKDDELLWDKIRINQVKQIHEKIFELEDFLFLRIDNNNVHPNEIAEEYLN